MREKQSIHAIAPPTSTGAAAPVNVFGREAKNQALKQFIIHN